VTTRQSLLHDRPADVVSPTQDKNVHLAIICNPLVAQARRPRTSAAGFAGGATYRSLRPQPMGPR
jgi:hypothetical protein